ncbi:NAD(P)-binding protein [Sistotremastrum suecicum HHB10207 ss-3]|uniref:NAD(P)-binding protein n=1 Tax=Sistotremastrum suecicum HHB10207 ss-3 TaxID=1314776 RepID=A0A166D581_9AGAM|nr:NAD(P)-binding protein [Sistotremastrum suecicum HHB10207 ss-3]
MGALFSRRFNPRDDLPDLHGKVIIVTGGSAGIGKYTALHLARRGAKVYLAARNESKTLNAIKDLELEGLGPGNGTLQYIQLNLSDPRSAKKSAEEFLQRESRLDVLINNAGFLEQQYAKTEDGLGESILANYLSPFLYTKTLIPLLEKTAQMPGTDVRIVNVSSGAHSVVPRKDAVYNSREALNIRFSDNRMGNLRRYGYAKLANILHINELQRRFDQEHTPIICLSLHPGTVSTPGGQELLKKMLPFGNFGKVLGRWLLKSQEDGAITSAFAAAASQVRTHADQYKAAYLIPYAKFGKKSKAANDPQKALDLWITSEGILEDLGL